MSARVPPRERGVSSIGLITLGQRFQRYHDWSRRWCIYDVETRCNRITAKSWSSSRGNQCLAVPCISLDHQTHTDFVDEDSVVMNRRHILKLTRTCHQVPMEQCTCVKNSTMLLQSYPCHNVQRRYQWNLGFRSHYRVMLLSRGRRDDAWFTDWLAISRDILPSYKQPRKRNGDDGFDRASYRMLSSINHGGCITHDVGFCQALRPSWVTVYRQGESTLF